MGISVARTCQHHIQEWAKVKIEKEPGIILILKFNMILIYKYIKKQNVSKITIKHLSFNFLFFFYSIL